MMHSKMSSVMSFFMLASGKMPTVLCFLWWYIGFMEVYIILYEDRNIVFVL
jgi:hypothetical protein